VLDPVGVPRHPLLHDLDVGFDPGQLDFRVLDLTGTPRQDGLGGVEGAGEGGELGVLRERLGLVLDNDLTFMSMELKKNVGGQALTG
jgi:hypothetical protein